MLKRDPIFWWATGIFALALLLMAVTQNQLWLVLMIGSYLLRPTLASLGVARRYVDERQMSIQYRSGNIAFATMIITCIVLAIKLNADGNPSWEMFNVAIIAGLATKALFNVILVKNYREAATKIIIAAGLLITLFTSMDSMEGGPSLGTLINVSPGLAIVGLGLLSKKFPREIGGIILVITAVLVLIIFSKGLTIYQVATALLVAVPLVTAAACLFTRDKSEPEIEPKEPT